MDAIQTASIVHKNLCKLSFLLAEDSANSGKAFDFDQLRLVEEVLSQGDH
jgi:hypothetical protein